MEGGGRSTERLIPSFGAGAPMSSASGGSAPTSRWSRPADQIGTAPGDSGRRPARRGAMHATCSPQKAGRLSCLRRIPSPTGHPKTRQTVSITMNVFHPECYSITPTCLHPVLHRVHVGIPVQIRMLPSPCLLVMLAFWRLAEEIESVPCSSAFMKYPIGPLPDSNPRREEDAVPPLPRFVPSYQLRICRRVKEQMVTKPEVCHDTKGDGEREFFASASYCVSWWGRGGPQAYKENGRRMM